MKEDQPSILGIALIICRNPLTGKYLAVYEKNKTWWVPGGRVDAPESFSDGARRECIEEAGINVELKGILRIEQSGGGYNMNRLKIIYYSEPVDPHQIPKQIADKQSIKAAYLTLKEILELRSEWRGPQLYSWASYLQQGGKIYPLSTVKQISK